MTADDCELAALMAQVRAGDGVIHEAVNDAGDAVHEEAVLAQIEEDTVAASCPRKSVSRSTFDNKEQVRNRWVAFVSKYGASLGFDERLEPHPDLIKKFYAYCFRNRAEWSCVGRQGIGKSTCRLVDYYLSYTFIQLNYVGWRGLSASQLLEKAKDLRLQLKNYYQKLVNATGNVDGTGKPFVKKRFCTVLRMISQDRIMEDTIQLNATVTQVAITSFIYATCTRPGSFSKDAHELSGECPIWSNQNVLSLRDFMFDRDEFEVTYDGKVELDALRGEVSLNRVKMRYKEKYNYEMTFSPDAADIMRRSTTFMLIYFIRRGAFEVMYSGLSTDERAAVFAARRMHGFKGGLPEEARISESELLRAIVKDRKLAFAEEVKDEPLFVSLKPNQFFEANSELPVKHVRTMFQELGMELGLDPCHAGSYSVRRSSSVDTRRGCEANGMSNEAAKKLMAHRFSHQVMETVYDDDVASTDIGALQSGRSVKVIEGLRSLLATRVPDMKKYRYFGNLDRDDPVRIRIFEEDPQRVRLKAAVESLTKTHAQLVKAGASVLGEQFDELLDTSSKNLKRAKGMVSSREQTLRYRTCKIKRMEYFEEKQAELATLPMSTLKERWTVKDYKDVTLEQAVVKFGFQEDLSRHIKRSTTRSQSFYLWLTEAEADSVRAQVNESRAKDATDRRAIRKRKLNEMRDRRASSKSAISRTETVRGVEELNLS